MTEENDCICMHLRSELFSFVLRRIFLIYTVAGLGKLPHAHQSGETVYFGG